MGVGKQLSKCSQKEGLKVRRSVGTLGSLGRAGFPQVGDVFEEEEEEEWR